MGYQEVQWGTSVLQYWEGQYRRVMASWAILVSASEIKEESMLIISVVVLPTGDRKSVV